MTKYQTKVSLTLTPVPSNRFPIQDTNFHFILQTDQQTHKLTAMTSGLAAISFIKSPDLGIVEHYSLNTSVYNCLVVYTSVYR